MMLGPCCPNTCGNGSHFAATLDQGPIAITVASASITDPSTSDCVSAFERWRADDWRESREHAKPVLLSLAAAYYLGAKGPGGKPLDPVARFHLGNGARLERLKHPWRIYSTYAVLYVAIPVVLLVIAHVLVTIVFNISPLYLRLASVLIPVPFGFLAFGRCLGSF